MHYKRGGKWVKLPSGKDDEEEEEESAPGEDDFGQLVPRPVKSLLLAKDTNIFSIGAHTQVSHQDKMFEALAELVWIRYHTVNGDEIRDSIINETVDGKTALYEKHCDKIMEHQYNLQLTTIKWFRAGVDATIKMLGLEQWGKLRSMNKRQCGAISGSRIRSRWLARCTGRPRTQSI